MKFQSVATAALICVVTASPVPDRAVLVPRLNTARLDAARAGAARLDTRQDGTDTSNDLVDGICREVTFIFARGSLEAGNMGSIVGPQVCTDLQSTLSTDTVACQGVGSPYNATLADNFLPQNTSPTDIGAATSMFDLANTQCPDTLIVAGGYSQGSAVMDGSIQALPAALMAKIKGVVLFGFTRNEQDGGRIPNYPTNETKVYCADGDLVCNDTLIITPAHLTYGVDAPDAAAFLVSALGL
ncbi:putative cutinase 3 [Mollisia scopiformis]|uniref:Cutinase n=1 Tax=Mollisia scopiformis TaxID=149040 RepID=A0A194XXG3_MOLSC|nr:putative cutinase 3 [Mollisia scopiformis]KUJ24487.1 putative cutinase 3 [Mollisia scopiformis]